MASRRQRVVVRTWLIKAIGNSKRTLAFGETITKAWWSRFNLSEHLQIITGLKETLNASRK